MIFIVSQYWIDIGLPDLPPPLNHLNFISISVLNLDSFLPIYAFTSSIPTRASGSCSTILTSDGRLLSDSGRK